MCANFSDYHYLTTVHCNTKNIVIYAEATLLWQYITAPTTSDNYDRVAEEIVAATVIYGYEVRINDV